MAETTDAERLAALRDKYRGLQGNMPPFGDILFLLRLLAEQEADIAKLRAIASALDEALAQQDNGGETLESVQRQEGDGHAV